MADRYASLKQGLVGCWIPSVSGSGLLLPDLSGRGNNGSLVNMDASDWVSSQYGRALDFDGVDDVVVGSRTTAPLGQCCMSAWIYPRNVNAYQIIMSEDPTDSNPSLRNFVFGYGLTTGRLIAIDFRGASFTIYESNASLTANTWQHAAWNRSSSGMAFFVNGVQSGSTFTYPGALNSNNIPTRIGARAIPSNETYANMLVDDIRVFNRALSEAEIRLLASEPGIGFKPAKKLSRFSQRFTYNPPKARNYGVVRVKETDYATLRQGLVGAWCPSLPSGGSGNTLPDVSGYGNHGSLVGMGPEDWVGGQYGRALDFDGNDDRVVASGNTSFTNGVVSVSGWMRRTGTAGQNNAVVFSKGTLEGNANSTCALYWNETLGWSWFIVDAANNLTIVRSNTVTSQSQWVHIAGVASPAGVFLYLNGVLANSTTTAAVKNSTHESFIGGASVGGGTFASLLGQVDDVRIYNRVLSEPEIKLLASRPGIGLRQESHRNTFYQFPSGARRKRILTGMP